MLKRFIIFPALWGCAFAIALLLTQSQVKRFFYTTVPQGFDQSPSDNTFESRLSQPPFSFADAAAKATPSVVNLYDAELSTISASRWMEAPDMQQRMAKEDIPQRHRMLTSLGSGVIADADGHFLTNYHVVAQAKSIIAALPDGREAPVNWVGFDTETDLAVLQINLPNLEAITWANANPLRVGDSVLAIGNPFGIGQTVTRGVVSAVNRSGLNLSTFESFIQTDAAINPGNSGGALIDVYGHLVGINTALFSHSGGSQGIGFAIPASIAKKVLEDIVNHGKVIRGWLGLYTQPLGPSRFGTTNQETFGLLVSRVTPNSPAAKADLKVGDVLLAINKSPLTSEQHSRQIIADLPPGQDIELGIRRGENMLTLSATIGLRPANSDEITHSNANLKEPVQ